MKAPDGGMSVYYESSASGRTDGQARLAGCADICRQDGMSAGCCVPVARVQHRPKRSVDMPQAERKARRGMSVYQT